MDDRGGIPGAAGLVLVDGVSLFRPEEQVFEAMLEGFANQQLARNLAYSTVQSREHQLRAFAGHAEAFPWLWSPHLADEWFSDLRAVRHVARSTVRSYQVAIRGFCSYLIDPAYGWAAECERRFGTHPIQVIHEVNAAAHVADSEAEPTRRAFTRAELQALFDHADDEVARKRALGRKGWLPAFRDATIFKIAYGYGTRRTETAMLDAADFGRNPDGPEFGDYGVCYIRHGKAQRGSPPKRRSVLTVWAWTSEVLEQWFTEIRPHFGLQNNPAAWPSERGLHVGPQQLNKRLAGYRDTLGLDPALDFHSLRRSYVTHLIEDGWDPRFVQEQVGHNHASTTSIYTCVSSDYRTRTLRRALDAMVADALNPALKPAESNPTGGTR
ncbi:site-specific recombinase XerD [Kribbella sp. VKM Ac-2571]|uniref:tyrosine-type recombinase/integrase n=1 Tax=Kribbella sp. VKM Ac-2571 TaxID=2512222 RepID=UPI0010E61597|nr:site-specific integrase [Kribbella sp. VKM Ac-2571]TDO44438.1 site-specific recombinase XerD [Kribbella sp. VKM Ac-2571]